MSLAEMGHEHLTPAERIADKRYEVPDLIPYLRPGEIVTEVETYPDINLPAKEGLASSLSELIRLAGASRMSELGSHGPVVASKSQEHENRMELKAYEVVFGRDSLIVAEFLKNYYPNLLRSTLRNMASLQGVKFNADSEEEVGKIVHEARDPNDPIARQITERSGWQWPYYGSVDATALYVKELAEEARHDPDFLKETYTDRNGEEHDLMHSMERALGYINQQTAKSPLGLLEYKRLNPNGLQNQWWEDSWDSMSRRDGSLANLDQPIAALVVQAFAYDALLGAGELYRELSAKNPALAEKAQIYSAMADNIKHQVMEKFWKHDKQGGYFVVGLDRDEQGNYRQLDTKTCNMGFVLTSRLLDDDSARSKALAEQTAKTLFTPEMQNASGLRTLSKNEKRFRPGGYHTGNVWLWVNNWVANGLDKHAKLSGNQDYAHKAWQLREKTWNVVQKYKKFPELVNGGDAPEPMLNWRKVTVKVPEATNNTWTPGANTIEQPAQDYQAWTIAAYIDALRKNNPLSRTQAG